MTHHNNLLFLQSSIESIKQFFKQTASAEICPVICSSYRSSGMSACVSLGHFPSDALPVVPLPMPSYGTTYGAGALRKVERVIGCILAYISGNKRKGA